MADEKPLEQAEANLNRTSAKDAARFEKQVTIFRTRVLRAGMRDEDVTFYEAAIFSWTVTQMVEILRSESAQRGRETGQAASDVGGLREESLRPARTILESARNYCVREDAKPDGSGAWPRESGCVMAPSGLR
jgi:hypothetical protein